MYAEFDPAKVTNSFLYELATKTKSPRTLQEIVEYAINEDQYDDQTAEFCRDDDFYLDAVVSNPNTSMETLFAIIEYPSAPYSRWKILESKKLDNTIIEKFANVEKEFPLLCIMIENHPITKNVADIIATRLINNKINMSDRIIGENPEVMAESEKNAIETIIKICSDELEEKLRRWYY